MKVRLTQPWRQWSKGYVFADMPGGQGRTMIDRGIAEEVVAEGEQEQKALRAPADRALRRRDLVTRS